MGTNVREKDTCVFIQVSFTGEAVHSVGRQPPACVPDSPASILNDQSPLASAAWRASHTTLPAPHPRCLIPTLIYLPSRQLRKDSREVTAKLAH